MAIIKKKIKTPIYGTNVVIVIYDSDDEFQNEFKNIEFDPAIDSFDGGVFWHDDKLFCVFSSEKENYPTPGIIAHEAKHLVNNIFIDISHKLDAYNDEPECYLLQWFVNRIHEILNNKIKKYGTKKSD